VKDELLAQTKVVGALWLRGLSVPESAQEFDELLTVNKQAFERATRPVDGTRLSDARRYVYLWTAASWRQHACPVFDLTPGISISLALTDPPAPEHAPMPFPAIAIRATGLGDIQAEDRPTGTSCADIGGSSLTGQDAPSAAYNGLRPSGRDPRTVPNGTLATRCASNYPTAGTRS
jgi:hypothetical protein